MSVNSGDYEQLLEFSIERYNENTILGKWFSSNMSTKQPGTNYHRNRLTHPNMSSNFNPEITASKLIDNIVDREKCIVIQAILEVDELEKRSIANYSMSELGDVVGRRFDSNLLLLPTKKGRPKRITDNFGNPNKLPFGSDGVAVRYVNSEMFYFDVGIILDSDRVSASQLRVADMDLPQDFDLQNNDVLSSDDDLIQMAIGKDESEGGAELLIQTMFSELQGVDNDTVGLIELPD